MNPPDPFHDGGERSSLRAELHDAMVLAGGGDGQLAFARVVARGLLDIHVLARRAAEDGGGSMPMVRRGTEQYVDVLVVEGLAKVGGAGGLALLALANGFEHATDDAFI